MTFAEIIAASAARGIHLDSLDEDFRDGAPVVYRFGELENAALPYAGR